MDKDNTQPSCNFEVALSTKEEDCLTKGCMKQRAIVSTSFTDTKL